MNTACHESCKTHGPGKVNPGHDLYGYMRHAWHQCSCSLHHSTTTRHDQVLTILQKYFRTYCGILAEQGQFLNRDNDTRKSTDLLLTFPNWPGARSMSVDYTCLCPYLPKYSASASANFAKAQADREKDKVDHHAEWCRKTHNRDFLGLPGSTLGSLGTPGCCRCGSCAVCAVAAAYQVAERTSCSCGECHHRPWAQRVMH